MCGSLEHTLTHDLHHGAAFSRFDTKATDGRTKVENKLFKVDDVVSDFEIGNGVDRTNVD